MSMDDPLQNVALSTFGEVRIGGTQMLAEEVATDRLAYGRQITYAERTRGSWTLDTRSWAESGMTSKARWSHIVALRYMEPGTSLGPEE